MAALDQASVSLDQAAPSQTPLDQTAPSRTPLDQAAPSRTSLDEAVLGQALLNQAPFGQVSQDQASQDQASRDQASLDWAALAFASLPADRVAAEAGVRRAYRCAGLAEPEEILWVGSPAAGAVAAAWLTGGAKARKELACATTLSTYLPAERVVGPCVRDQVRTDPWAEARRVVADELGPLGWARLWGGTGALLWPRVQRILGDIRDAFDGLAGPSAGAVLRRAALDAVLGQHDAAWLSAFDPARFPELEALTQVSAAAGWWWPYERVAIISERPTAVHLDDSFRLHRADGPALAYPDGFAVHAWHGMPVPPDFGATLSSLDATRIAAEQNAELRRVMVEHYGFDRYLSESGAQPLHSDETGTLWRITLPEDEDIVLVEVLNSTPEPDGTSRTYFLRVPPWVERARQGVAWTFGVEEKDYQPVRET